MKTSFSRRKFLLGSSGAGLTGLAGCTGGVISDAGDNTVRLGYLGPLSGPFAPIGTSMQEGMELGVSDMNDAEDGPDFEMVAKDSELSPETSIDRARSMVEEDGVDVITGIGSSSVAKALIPFGESENVPVITSGAQSHDITGKDCSRFLFRTIPDGWFVQPTTAKAVSDIVIDKDNPRLAAIIPDYTLGHENWNAFKPALEEQQDFELVAEMTPEFGAGDFQNEIQKAIDVEPDLVVTWLYGGDLVKFIQQAKDYDFFEEIPNFVYAGGGSGDVPKTLGENMESFWANAIYYYRYPDTEMNRQFVEKMEAEYDKTPVSITHESYSVPLALSQAVQEAGSTDTDPLIDGLEGLQIQTPGGQKTLRAEDHACLNENLPFGRYTPSDERDYYTLSDVTLLDGIKYDPDPECEM